MAARRGKEGTYRGRRRTEGLSLKPGSQRHVPWPSRPLWWEKRAGSTGHNHPWVPASSQQALTPPGLWPPAVHRCLGPRPGLGHPGPLGQDCQEQVALGEGPAARPEDEENATFVCCSHLALAARGGGQRQPLRLGPAHREFLKDARGCWEGGRRGRGGWAGPPNPPPKKEGAGRMRGGGGGGGGRPSAWPLSASPRGRREQPAQAPAGPADGRAAPAPCCSRPPAQAL